MTLKIKSKVENSQHVVPSHGHHQLFVHEEGPSGNFFCPPQVQTRPSEQSNQYWNQLFQQQGRCSQQGNLKPDATEQIFEILISSCTTSNQVCFSLRHAKMLKKVWTSQQTNNISSICKCNIILQKQDFLTVSYNMIKKC